jgi:hypothetical protein
MAGEQILIKKLDEFIRKYYKNRLMRGWLWAFSLLAMYYLILILSEYFFHFNQAVRTVLFFTFLTTTLFLIARLIIIPILQLIRIGKVISYVQAAEIIGTHFLEIQDKLLNTLQLIKQNENPEEHSDLLTASIEQKTQSLRVFRFTKVIDFRKNLPYLRFAVIPGVIIILLAILSPKIISDPTNRILQFNQPFTQPEHFKLEILNKNLSAVQQGDFELGVVATGNEIPSEVFIKTRDVTYKMTKNKGFIFSYLFKSLQGNIPFMLIAGEYSSKAYEIQVFPKPTILGFDVEIKYPGYINKPSEKIENVGDLTIPEGAEVTWNFFTKDVTMLKLRFGDKKINLKVKKNNTFTHSEINLKTSFYCISPANENSLLSDSLVYGINVVSDGFPTIFVTETMDSTLNTAMFFKGTVKDDYGFTRLTFNYIPFIKDDTAKGNMVSENIPIDKNINNQVFYHTVDFLKLMPEAGMNIRYYFEIWDNDEIHGPKSTQSESRTISTPTTEEIVLQTDKNEQSMSEEIERSLRESKSIQKTMDELNKKLVDQSSISFQEKKKIEELIRANLAIGEKVKEVIRKSKENIDNEEKYLETSERIIEKQKQLNELMEQLLSDELKKMVEEMRDLLKRVDKTKLGNLMEKMKLSNKDLETQLDRNLALMKQIEFERKLEAISNELRKTADKLDILADETLGQLKPNEQLIEKQRNINNKADSLSKNINDLKKEGEQLETPAELGKTEEKQDSILKNLEDSKRKLEEKKNNDASKSQKKAAKQMKDLAKQMEDSQLENEDEQLGEDASNLRMILENLVRLSFEQERLIGNTRIIARNDPRYPEIVVRQREFGDKLTVVEDSLNSIAKRQIMMKPFVTKEISAIRQNIDLALEAMDSRNINVAVAKQQYSMTSINNLAVLLSESLEKMNEQMSSNIKSKGGNKACKNPSGKGGKMSAKGMKDLQNKIGQQLQQLKSGMESKSGQEGGSKAQQNAINKQIAKLAAQQEALRNEMQRYQDEIGSKGIKDQGSLNEASKEMEQIERDIINKEITQETIRRQQNIMTRLLESEKAEQKREQEEKRESTEAKNQKFSNPEQNFQYNIKKKTSFDNIQLTLPVISSFYKSKVNSYIVKIGY